MFQKQLDPPWHTSSLKDTSLQLISWNLRASRRKVLWVTSFLWEGIFQAKSLLTDILTPEFFQLSIHLDCFLSSEEKCLWKVMHFYPLLSDSFNASIFFLQKRKKNYIYVVVSALDTEVFALPAKQMETYNASRASFPHYRVHLLFFIKACRKSLLNTRCVNGSAGIKRKLPGSSPLPYDSSAGTPCEHGWRTQLWEGLRPGPLLREESLICRLLCLETLSRRFFLLLLLLWFTATGTSLTSMALTVVPYYSPDPGKQRLMGLRGKRTVSFILHGFLRALSVQVVQARAAERPTAGWTAVLHRKVNSRTGDVGGSAPCRTPAAVLPFRSRYRRPRYHTTLLPLNPGSIRYRCTINF